MVPFSSGNHVTLNTDSTGAARTVSLLGYGAQSPYIALSGGQFQLSNYYQYAFNLAQDCVVSAIAASFANWGGFTPPTGGNVYPFIVLATADATSNAFTLLPETKTVASAPWPGGQGSVANTTLSALNDGLAVPLSAGTRVIVCAGFDITDKGSAQGYDFYYSGSVIFS